ncbi:hypothetical protein HJB79_19745 [Rhizobium lentis]|uniref:hypothetical protein n=1 Tax=Rhizobium TaxID=379 RepID=UPI00159680FF|nr:MULTISPECIES: hypothetical protein [Rhizobium]MBB3353942.1 hypothetical protein [Rhizobium sp. BK049]MBX5135081.1 hypothetical protein [Rhizobium lentis]MBX5140987.1 hypothetical protein [Rhizobium lentis]MBX5153272.1 hypothetical protein [Rhizobium lentis]MBX5178347.1 hypothetical protein [Rhizobium lentis]
MDQIVLNSTVAILVAAAFLTSAVSALRSGDRSRQRVPVKIRVQRDRNTGKRF